MSVCDKLNQVVKVQNWTGGADKTYYHVKDFVMAKDTKGSKGVFQLKCVIQIINKQTNKQTNKTRSSPWSKKSLYNLMLEIKFE